MKKDLFFADLPVLWDGKQFIEGCNNIMECVAAVADANGKGGVNKYCGAPGTQGSVRGIALAVGSVQNRFS